jgi:hypothetical protein
MESRIEEIAAASEDLDNLIHAMMLPIPPAFHLEVLKTALPKVRDQLRATYIAMGGENHWE